MTAAGTGSRPGAVLEEIPFFDPRYKRDPHAWYAELARRPPFWALAEGKRVVVAARFHDVEAIYRDHDTFSSVKPPEPGMERFDFFNGFQDLVHTDPPEHTRLRAVVQPAFSPAAVSRLETAVRALVDELLEPILAGPEEFELMAQFARPLSTRTMLGILLGMDSGDFPVFVDLSRAMELLSEVPAGGRPPQAYADAWEAGRRYCLRLIEARRAAPGNDLAGIVIAAHLDGRLSADELFVMLIGLFVGGLSTIATQVGNGLYHLVSRPEQYRLLVADPALAANAFEEAMRFDSAGLFNYKFAKRDCVFESLEIPAGTTVYILQHATGFDPAVYEDPFRFDIRRNVRRHLGFGFGVHVCLGAPLARLVGRSVLARFAQRLPGLRLACDAPLRYGGWLQERAPEEVRLRRR